MNKDNHPILQPIEQARLLLAASLVATAIAVIQMLPDMADNSMETFIKGVFAISAFSGFLFILITAAILKSSKTDEVGNLPFTERFRMRCYNYCVNSYGVQISGGIMFGIAYALGWTFAKDVWDWRVGLGALLTLSFSALVIYMVRYRNK